MEKWQLEDESSGGQGRKTGIWSRLTWQGLPRGIDRELHVAVGGGGQRCCRSDGRKDQKEDCLQVWVLMWRGAAPTWLEQNHVWAHEEAVRGTR